MREYGAIGGAAFGWFGGDPSGPVYAVGLTEDDMNHPQVKHTD